MTTRRTEKVAEAIRQVVSTAILFGLRDPRVQHVTILRVETPFDLRTSKIYVSVLGDEKTQRLTMKGLDAARGYLQSKIAEELDLRFTPVLTFILDQGVKKSIAASQLLRKLDVEDAARAGEHPTETAQAVPPPEEALEEEDTEEDTEDDDEDDDEDTETDEDDDAESGEDSVTPPAPNES